MKDAPAWAPVEAVIATRPRAQPKSRVNLKQVAEGLKEIAVLSIGETEALTLCGGVVKLLLEENRVGIEINVAAAACARLKLSAKLPAAAQVLTDERCAGGN